VKKAKPRIKAEAVVALVAHAVSAVRVATVIDAGPRYPKRKGRAGFPWAAPRISRLVFSVRPALLAVDGDEE
jgi:hypothetical protein